MAYELEVDGRAEGSLRAALSERIGEGSIRVDEGTLTLWIPDQSALLAIVRQLHDLNITVEQVRHLGR